MKEFKGSQGGWLISTANEGETENIKINNSGKLITIQDFHGKAIAILGRIGEPEQEANAKVMRGLPEMINCLQRVILLKDLFLYPQTTKEEHKGEAIEINGLIQEIEKLMEELLE